MVARHSFCAPVANGIKKVKDMSKINKSVVLFVPHWIARALDNEGLSYNKLFNLSELRKHFSVEDLSILYWSNNKNDLFTNSYGMIECNIWTSADDVNYIQNQLIPTAPLALDAINARLGNNEMTQSYITASDYTPFKITNIADKRNVFVVVQYPGMTAEHNSMLVTELLKLLYAHEGYDNMANNQLFKSYIDKLALVNNVL